MIEDGALVRRYRETRREADFTELYRRCTPALWRLALRLARGSEADAEDLIGETWLRAVARLHTFRTDRRLGPWLAGIAWNCWRERTRRCPDGARAVHPLASGAREQHRVAAPPPHAERMDLRAALDALPEGYRTTLVLHDLEGYTHAEIGEALGVSEGTSKSQLSRGRAALRRILAPQARPNGPRSTTAEHGR